MKVQIRMIWMVQHSNCNTRQNPNPKLCRNGRFKHVEGKNGTTTFLPNKSKRGGTFGNVKNDKYLKEDQDKFVHKRVNAGKRHKYQNNTTGNETRKSRNRIRKHLPKGHTN